MRTPFTGLTGIAAPLRWSDVNTDDIFPAAMASPIARLRGSAILNDRARMGDNAFAAYRWTDAGEPRPDFVLNRPPYDRAEILVAGSNFGCGSSREAAVWCLAAIGIRCIIAPSFGDIFYGNCLQNGLLPVRLPDADVEALTRQVEQAHEPTLDVDLRRCTVTTPTGECFAFSVPEYSREALLRGLNEIEVTLARMDRIHAFEATYFAERPWLITPEPTATR